MSNSVNGTVFKIYEKDWNGKTLYSIKLDGDKNYYGCGTRSPACKAGDVVEFDFVEKGQYKNADVKTVKVTGAKPATAAHKGGSGGGGTSRDDYWDKKDQYDKNVRQKLICYQSATKDAVALAVAALENGILPTAGSKKADKYESFLDIVDKVRDDIYTSYEVAVNKLEKGEPLVKPKIKEASDGQFPEENWDE